MKKNVIFLLLFIVSGAIAQHKRIDTLSVALKNSTVDTVRLNILIDMGKIYFTSNPDSSIIVGQQAYELAVKYNKQYAIANSLNLMANAYATMGDYAKGMQFYLKARRAYEQLNYVPGIVKENNNIGATYVQKTDYKSALPYLQMANSQWKTYLLSHKISTLSDRESQAITFINIGECYLYTHQIDSADRYLQACNKDAKKNNFTLLLDNIERDLGEVEIERGHIEAALKHLRNAVTLGVLADDPEMLSITYLSFAKLYHKYAEPDSAKYYAQKALETARTGKYQQDVLNAGKILYSYYDEEHNIVQAYKYYKITAEAKDSLYSQDKVKQLLSIDFEEKQRQQDIASAQEQYRNKTRMYALIIGLALLMLLVFIFWRNGRHRQNANRLLQTQKEDIENALSRLQLTQKQLVQSEKMASLGELTAGIAHEIQNPLNFVNNFAEVNIELLDEMETELKSGDKEEALAIASDVKQNLEKIRHHGQRADGIVKGMLQHSRASSNTKESTDVNKLADEYLRLAYHGLRAKDKNFNAELETNFDPKLPLVNLVPQDIGRVLLNLFTNAFYATEQKKKLAAGHYNPVVKVGTAKIGNNLEIRVRDNGNGIPDDIRDKVMQPFFTTKPTGEGTGLGLSMSYDIVVKGHGGSIQVESKEGEFTEFIIQIPV
ncbi:MAG: ATP-binding region ATPase domain protein [Mucilaginibacter sp.]|nr:ATP-binding region ATPase domain protein [Mucilaginibacter sp.]